MDDLSILGYGGKSSECVVKAEKKKKVKKQDVVLSAFDSIFDIYKDIEAISAAIKSAEERLVSLKEDLENDINNGARFQAQFERIEEELQTLEGMVCESETDEYSEGWMTRAMGKVYDFANVAATFVLTEEDRIKQQKNIDDTIRFIKMLKGVKAVAENGGMKGGKEDDIDGRMEGVQ